MSGTKELVDVEQVDNNESKKTKLGDYTPFDPIKTTPQSNDLPNNNFSKQSNSKLGVTAVLAVISAGSKVQHSSKKVPKKKLIRVLLDSGSDGDLLFHKRGTPKHFPYLTRQVPKTWHTSNGDFQTKGKGDIQLKFFDYSISKRVHVQPDVVYYEETMEKPVFDLILGTKTMNELGIVLNFKQNTITIDEIELPMTSITNMPTSKIKKALTLNNSLAKVQEPKSTEEAT